MTPRPPGADQHSSTGRRRPVRACLALGVLAAALLPTALELVPSLPGVLPGARAAAAATPASMTGQLLLDRMTTVLQPGSTLQIRGRLHLPAGEASLLQRSEITLFAGSALNSRGELHGKRDNATAQVSGSQVGQSVPVTSKGTFGIDVPADEAPWRSAGVYPLTLQARAPLPAGTTTVATLTTFLPYFPDGVAQKAPFTLVVPVTAQPEVVSPGTLVDDRVQSEVATGGRLDRLLSLGDSGTALAGAGGLTLAIDTSLTDTLTTMARGAWRDVTSGKAHPADPGAGSTLRRLDELAGATTPMLLTYGDVDATALTSAGDAATVGTSVQVARDHLPEGLANAGVSDGIALPAGGCATSAAFSALIAAKQSAAIVSDSCVPPDPALSYTPSARTRVLLSGRPLDLLVSDGELSRLITAGPSTASTARAAEQLVLAETAMIVLEQPNLPRSIVAAVPRDWSPAAGWLQTVLRDTSSVPWLSVTSAKAVLAGPEVARGPLVAHDGNALPVSYITAVTDGQATLAGVCTILPAVPKSLRHDCELPWTFLGAESVNFRSDLPAGRSLLTALVNRARAYGSAVHVAASPVVTLTSRAGKVPVVLENDLPQPVTVHLTLQARDRSRLRSATVVTRTLLAKQKVQVEIRVRAEGAGRFPVELMLLSPSGQRLGAPLSITVRSTAYGVLAIAITVGAVGVLFLAVAIRGGRRLLGLRRRHTLSSPPAASPPAASPPAGPAA